MVALFVVVLEQATKVTGSDLPGILTAVGAVIAAITALVLGVMATANKRKTDQTVIDTARDEGMFQRLHAENQRLYQRLSEYDQRQTELEAEVRHLHVALHKALGRITQLEEFCVEHGLEIPVP